MLRRRRGLAAAATVAGVLIAAPVALAAVTITSGPPPYTNQPTADFTFTGGTSYQCKLDSGTFAACTSPQDLTGISEGSHTFSVQSVGASGGTPATWSWTADFTPPTTTLTSAPPDVTNSSSATFTFTSNEPGTFQCSLNGAAPTACSSPVTYNGLSDAKRTFTVAAVDRAGNVDPNPQSKTWTIDLTPPHLTITAHPASLAGSSAQFSFSADEPSAFKCSLDGGTPGPCANSNFNNSLSTAGGEQYANLGNGTHTFAVWGTDQFGNADPTPTTYTWIVDSTGPSSPRVAIGPYSGRLHFPKIPKGFPTQFVNPVRRLTKTSELQLTNTLVVQWDAGAQRAHKAPAGGATGEPTVAYDIAINWEPITSDITTNYHFRWLATRTTKHALALRVVPGTVYCVQVTAWDPNNLRQVTTTCVTVPLSVTQLQRQNFKLGDGKGYLNGKFARSDTWGSLKTGKVLGSSQHLSIDGTIKKVELVAMKCPSCGKLLVRVRLTNAQVDVDVPVNLHAANAHRSVIPIWVPGLNQDLGPVEVSARLVPATGKAVIEGIAIFWDEPVPGAWPPWPW